MKNSLTTLFIAGGLALTGAIAGCNRGADEAQAPPAATTAPPAASETATAPAAGTGAAALGRAQAAGPFQVTLATDPATPTEGDTRLIATVTRDGKPVEDAEVKAALSMPTMNMGGPEVELDHKDDGRYEETANLSMGGAWQAVVTVKDEGETGTATYTFNAMQK